MGRGPWFRRRTFRRRVTYSVLGSVVGVAAALLLDAIKALAVPADAAFWIAAGGAVVFAVLGDRAGRLIDGWMERRARVVHDARTLSGIDPLGDVRNHFVPRGRGNMSAAQAGFRFRGRRRALHRINEWLRSGRGVLVVTGDPGSGKSAVLGRVVMTAYAPTRRPLPPDDAGLRVPLGSVACEIYAKDKTAHDVATEIGHELGAAAATTPEDLPSLLQRQLEGLHRRFVIVLDALDEAADPRDLIAQVLRPLVDADPSLGVQLLVGTRRRDDRGMLPAAVSSHRVEIDLDSDEYFDPSDVVNYALTCLQRPAAENPHQPYRQAHLAHALARRIAHDAGTNFLVAGLVAAEHGLYDKEPVVPSALRRGTTLPEVLSGFLDRHGPVDGVPARDLLLPLAYTDAPGLTLDLWRHLLAALCGRTVSERSLRLFVTSTAANLLVTTSDGEVGSGEGVFRLFHEALSETLRHEREHAALDAVGHDRRAIADALWGLGSRDNGWIDGPRYLLRSFAKHLAEAGQTDRLLQLLDTGDYLLHADLPRLHAVLTQIDVSRARTYRTLIGTSPHAADLPPGERAAAFSVSAALRRDGVLQRRFAHAARSLGAPYLAAWANGHISTAIDQVLEGHTGRVTSVVVLPDDRIASIGDDDTIRVWDLSGVVGAVVALGRADRIRGLAALPDGRIVVGEGGRKVRIVDVDGGGEPVVLEGHNDWTTAVAVLPDGRVATSGSDGIVDVWDLTHGRPRIVLEGHSGMVRDVAALPDGRVVSGGLDRTVRVWDLTGGEVIVLRGHTDSVHGVAALPDGRIASGGSDGTVRIWDPDGGAEPMVLEGHAHWVEAVAVLPDGRVVSGSVDGTVRVWDLDGDQEPLVLSDLGNPVNAVAVLPDGRVVSGSEAAVLRIWDPAEHDEGQSRSRDFGTIYAMTLLPDGRIVTGGNRTVRVWSQDDGRQLRRLVGHTGPVWAVAATPDGRIASGSEDKTIRVWDPDGGTRPRVLEGHTEFVEAVAVLPDGRIISLGYDTTARMWDLASGTGPVMLDGGTDWLETAVPTPDGRLVTVGNDHVVRILDPDERIAPVALHASSSIDRAIALPDDRIVAGAGDGAVSILDPNGRSDAVVLGRHDSWVTALTALPGGRIATGSNDRTVRVWDTVAGGAPLMIRTGDPVIAVAATTLRERPGLLIAMESGLLAVELRLQADSPC